MFSSFPPVAFCIASLFAEHSTIKLMLLRLVLLFFFVCATILSSYLVSICACEFVVSLTEAHRAVGLCLDLVGHSGSRAAREEQD